MKRATRAAMAVVFAAILANGAQAASLSGSYLAGKHAANVADVEAAARYYASALRRDPENVALMDQAVLHLTAAGRMEDALAVAKTLEAASPGHRMAALLLTAERLRAKAYVEARDRVAATPDAYHPLVAALLGSWASFGAGEGDAVAKAFEPLGSRAIFSIFEGYHAGLVRHALGDVAGSVEAYRGAMAEMEAPTGRLARAFAAALAANGEREEAENILARAAAVAVGDGVLEAALAVVREGGELELIAATPEEGAAEALYGLAAALGRDGEDRLSLVYTRLAIWLRPEFDEATLLAAQLLEAQEQYDLAIAAYEAISPKSPLSRAAEIGRADALHRNGEDELAVETLRALIRREPEAADAQVALGDMMRRLERFAEGAVAYDRAIQLMDAAERPSWVLYYQRGICYERSGEWEKAEADFFRALDMEADQPLVLNYLGYSWLEMGRNYEEALDMIRKAVAARPTDGYIVDSLGWGYYRIGDFPNAVKELERAVELRPIDPVINDHFGDALWKVGRKREAEFQWRRALSFDPEEEDAARIVRKLDLGLDAVLEEEKSGAATDDAATANDGG